MMTANFTRSKTRPGTSAELSPKVTYLDIFRSFLNRAPVDNARADTRPPVCSHFSPDAYVAYRPVVVSQRLEVRESSRYSYGQQVSKGEKTTRVTNRSPAKVWLNIQQVTDYLGISRAAAYRLAQRIRSFPTPGIGLRFLLDDIDAYVEGECRAPLVTEYSPAAPPRLRIAAPGDDEEVLPGLTREELKRRAGF